MEKIEPKNKVIPVQIQTKYENKIESISGSGKVPKRGIRGRENL